MHAKHQSFLLQITFSFFRWDAEVDLVFLAGIHRHFVLYGLAEYLRRRFNKHFSADEVLKLLDRFYNLEMLEPDDDTEILNQEEDFCLPSSFFSKEES
ncbi:unnamed protein product [Cuscuta campestris]|uniref:Chromatin modification-related protein EAF7 n=1 Tax=Cuscuta campestris TaxID=132261 RepID=A0A484L3Z4_9ASTE|nr:unnamed protein product [Cuscuta campestris]